jgi:hypothetical protein
MRDQKGTATVSRNKITSEISTISRRASLGAHRLEADANRRFVENVKLTREFICGPLIWLALHFKFHLGRCATHCKTRVIRIVQPWAKSLWRASGMAL